MIIYSLRRRGASVQGVCQYLANTTWLASLASARNFTTARPVYKSKSDALRILFCGSDAFSCESLKALYAEHQRNRELVETLEVMVLPGKRVGRGLKEVRQVPCKTLAENLGLRLHQRETFRDWTLPEGINLVVVVSFRLFVPKRIILSAKYGGLNVHPSLLPHLRGPAPIHHAVLRGEPFTGVSLQTLDPTAFDHGTILAQTPAPGAPILPEVSLSELTHNLAVQGGKMLVQGLRDQVHVPPLENAGWVVVPDGTELVHAPKITKADMQMNWETWTVDEMLRKLNVFGSVWTQSLVAAGKGEGMKKRVLFVKIKAASKDEVAELRAVERVVKFVSDEGLEKEVAVKVDVLSNTCFFENESGMWMGVERVKVDGSVERGAADALRPFLREKQVNLQ